MEKFAWLSALHLSNENNPVLATGPGYVTMAPEPGTYASVLELQRGDKPGGLLSSTAMLSLHDGRERRWVLLQRDDQAVVAPGKWQFPAGRCSPDELPLHTACRELSEEVRIQGEFEDWSQTHIRVGEANIEFLTQDAVHFFRGRYVYVNNTVEFYYPMELNVSTFEGVSLSDAEPYGRTVRLFTAEQLGDLWQQGLLTDPVAAIVERVLATAPAASA